MGRRSQHTPEELRELILVATRRVVEEDGISQPSAREIARAIGYAPGTLYNMYENLADILLHVEARILRELDQAVAEATNGAKGRDAIRKFVGAYVDFACGNPRLWSLVTQHQPDAAVAIPDWYLDCVRAPQIRLEEMLSRAFPGSGSEANTRYAHMIWVSLHGLLQVAMTSKFGPLSRAAISRMSQEQVDGILSSYGRGTESERGSRRNDEANRPASPAE